jgi:SAM-dependent methyltransferase
MAEKRNPDLYTGAAPYYVVGRAAYPPELADRIATELDLDGTERLLDVGCGPGSLTLLLADRFAAAVGVDADAGMLQEADRQARMAGITNIEWRQLYAEELPADLGTFGLVTFAQSFHWMDQLRVARAVHGMLTPDGASVHVHATTHRGIETDAELPLPSPPYPALDELSRRYLGQPPPRFGGPGRSGESDVYRAAGFRGPTSITVARQVVTRRAEEVIAAHLSLSSSTPHLFGDRLDAFVDEARALLAAASPTGEFSEQLREVAADIWWR